MDQKSRKIEFSEDELEILRNCGGIDSILQLAFLYKSDDAFLALSSLLVFSKDAASPAKRIRKAGMLQVYTSLTKSVSVSQYRDPKTISLTYVTAIKGFKHLSPRWKHRYTFDELYCLTLMIDSEHGKGFINWSDFVHFADGIVLAFRSNPSYPQQALIKHYEEHVEGLYTKLKDFLQNIPLYDKLLKLSTKAQKVGLLPIQMLMEIKTKNINHFQDFSWDQFVVQLSNFSYQLACSSNGSPKTQLFSTSTEKMNSKKFNQELKEQIVEKLKAFQQKAERISESLQGTEEQYSAAVQLWQQLQLMELEVHKTQDLIAPTLNNSVEKSDFDESADISLNRISETPGSVISEIDENQESMNGNNLTPETPIITEENNGFISTIKKDEDSESNNVITSENKENTTEKKKSPRFANISKSDNKSSRWLKSSNNFFKDSKKKENIITKDEEKKVRNELLRRSPKVREPNLNIFKSPVSRQAHGNKNVYSEDSYSWVPTRIEREKYRKRSHTHVETLFQMKVHEMLRPLDS